MECVLRLNSNLTADRILRRVRVQPLLPQDTPIPLARFSLCCLAYASLALLACPDGRTNDSASLTRPTVAIPLDSSLLNWWT